MRPVGDLRGLLRLQQRTPSVGRQSVVPTVRCVLRQLSGQRGRELRSGPVLHRQRTGRHLQERHQTVRNLCAWMHHLHCQLGREMRSGWLYAGIHLRFTFNDLQRVRERLQVVHFEWPGILRPRSVQRRSWLRGDNQELRRLRSAVQLLRKQRSGQMRWPDGLHRLRLRLRRSEPNVQSLLLKLQFLRVVGGRKMRQRPVSTHLRTASSHWNVRLLYDELPDVRHRQLRKPVVYAVRRHLPEDQREDVRLVPS